MSAVAAKLVLATGNPGKLEEMRAILAPWKIDVRALSEFTDDAAEESGLSFVENAILKARFAAEVSGLAAIADDSGLEVDALQGAPGIYSARYAGEGADDEANRRRLLRELGALGAVERSARFRCAMVYMRWPTDPAPIVCQASWEGSIARAPAGEGGFGYDPLFCPDGIDGTAAEMPRDQKNRLSHRAQALRNLLHALPLGTTRP
jgi:XTP/dITP diphosphohydrolase